jgi:hypothetical protein
MARSLPQQFSADPSGWQYCQEIEAAAWDYSRRQSVAGWILGTGALVAVAAGAVVAGTTDTTTRGERVVVVSMPLLGAALGLGARAAFQRADDHSDLAASASLAMNSPGRAIELCNTALAAWNSNRPAANSILVQGLGKGGGVDGGRTGTGGTTGTDGTGTGGTTGGGGTGGTR